MAKLFYRNLCFVAGIICLALIICAYSQTNVKKKEAQTLADRVEQLTELTTKRSVIKLNGDKFRIFVKAAPRNYSMVIMFTALSPQRQCSICKHAGDEFRIVADSFRFSPTFSNKLFFAIVDFDDGSDIFQMLKLNSAPTFIHFPAKGKPKKADNMDIQRVGYGADAIARWVQERTEVPIRVFRPPNYAGTIVLVMLFLLVSGLLYLRRNNLDFLKSKNTWSIVAMVFTLAMTSGQMWNHIRGPPFLHKNQQGGISYIHGSSQGQFIMETYIIMLINGAVVFGFIMMNEAASGKGDARKRQIYAIAGLAMIAFFFSLNLSIFKQKAHGYPYSFLL